MNVNKGYALLLSVMIISAVLSAAVAFAGIVITDIRQTRESAYAMQSYARAESDIERALFVFRKGGEQALRDDIPEAGKRRVEAIEPVAPFVIGENDFAAIPIPDAWTDDVFRISRWIPGAACVSPEESWIEISQVFWNDEPQEGDSGFVIHRHPYPYSAVPFDVIVAYPDLPLTEVRVRALFCDIDALAVSIPSRLRITATAGVKNISQTAEVTVPRMAPASGLFDFVIFSECEIIKGINADPRCI